MCAANNNMVSKVAELMELKKMAEALAAEMDAITDEIKAYMGDEEQMLAGDYKVNYKTVMSTRVDTTALKKLLGADALAPYTKQIASRRFSIQ